MLHGFSVPLTPQGLSPLVSLPPWHYSSDCLVVEYWTDPAAVTALLPPGVASDPKSNGRSFVWFLDWQFTGSNDELTDPARYQYREAFVLVEAIFEGQPINYCPYIFVDNDAAIARGWTQGFPKKLGSVFQTRSFSAPSAAAAPLAKGSRFGGSLAAHGERLITTRIAPSKRYSWAWLHAWTALRAIERPCLIIRWWREALLKHAQEDQPEGHSHSNQLVASRDPVVRSRQF
jgi:hypothetical protein